MDGQSREFQLELNETIVQLDSESEEIANDNTQTGGDLPMTVDSGISKDVRVVMPKVGMVFESDDQAYEFYNRYARCVGFSIRKMSSTHRKDNTISRRVLCCSSEGVRRKHTRGSPKKARPDTRTNCKARMVIKLHDDGNYSVVEFIEEHNHDLAPPSKVHKLRSQRKIPDSAVIDNTPYAGIGSTGVYSNTSAEVGGPQNFNFMHLGCTNYLQRRRRNEILKKGDAQLLLDYFKFMQKENPYFFYSIQVDENNQMCSCFWCDVKSRIDYSFFGDVVCFDTTFRKNDYDKPYALFVGVNNHGQSIFFGCALLLDETTESFVWVFQTFLDAMNGKQPKTIFTDQVTAIASAVSQVLPNTHHRLCLRHIYQKAEKHLSHVFEKFKSFEKDFKSFIYDNETEEEFQSSWDVLLGKYNLAGHEWLQGLYQVRGKWAQAYGREHFCAGMTTTQRSEDMNNFLKKYFKRTLSLREFATQYEKAVTSRRLKEKHQDFVSMQTNPNLRTTWPAEARAAERYSRKIFMLFQDEYVRTLDFSAEGAGEDGTMSTYKVSSFGNIRPHTVTFDSSNNTVKCSCKKFEFVGILCGHALKILHSRKLPDLPSRYYLKRWTKDARGDAMLDDHGKSVQDDCPPSLTMRYSELSHIALSLAAKGASSENSSSFAKQVLTRGLEEIENFLKADPDQARPLEDIRSANHGNVGEESIENHLVANITLRDPPRKKAKGQQSGRTKGALEKARGTIDSQLRPTGAGRQSDPISVGAIGITSRPPMASNIPRLLLHPARPWNMSQYTQVGSINGSMGQVDQAVLLHSDTDSAQYGLISGGWSTPPSWQGKILPQNVVGCQGTSGLQGLSFRVAGPSNMPLMPSVYPQVYTEASAKLVNQVTSHHGINSTQSNQISSAETAQCPQIAVLGAGTFVRTQYIPRLREIADTVVVKAIWSRSEESARNAVELAREFFPEIECKWGDEGLDDIIQDGSILGVAIVLAGQAQVDISLRVLRAGKHVLQEKPAAASVSDAETALSCYNSFCAHFPRQPIWAVAENYRFEPAFVECRKFLNDIGDMMSVQVIVEGSMNSSNPYFSSTWRRNLTGGFILDMGVHFIAGLRMIVGCEVANVSAITSHVDKTLPAPDNISALFQLENGCGGVFVMVVSSRSPKIFWRVVGSKGTLQIERDNNDEQRGYSVSLYTAGGPCQSSFYPFSGVHEELKAFIHDISHAILKEGSYESEPRCSFTEGARDLAVLEAMLESATKQGAQVNVKKF